MILEYNARRFDDPDVPESWSKYVARAPSGIRVTGDRTGYRELYLHCGEQSFVVATTLGELLAHVGAAGERVEISDFGISSLLHHAFIPFPYSPYEGVHTLSMGDTATLETVAGRFVVALGHDYPWAISKSSNDRPPSEEKLLALLTDSTARQLQEFGGDGFLMLSSGKDSSAVAIALAEGGFRDVRCVTYDSGEDDPEPAVAADLCKRLGLKHETIEMPRDTDTSREALLRFFTQSASPGVDLSQIPYVLATAAALPAGGAVMDGGGNDSYMGYPVAGHDRTKLRFRIRSRTAASAVRKTTRVDSPLNYLARSRAEATFPGRTMRLGESAALYPEAVDTSRWWYEQSKTFRHLDDFDLFGEVQERHTGPGGSMQKQRLAANAIGLGSSLPWCDDGVADYYFNLPEADRYDREGLIGKVLLRRMLLRYADYDADAIGKHYFAFDGAEFIARNMEFVRAEIDQCTLWADDGLSTVHRWLDQIDSRPLLYHSLLPVFMVSGWHNHSRFLNGEGGDTGRSPLVRATVSTNPRNTDR